MKRNYLFKNTGRISLVIGLLVTTLLSSCLKDNSPGTIDFSKSPALIGFQYAGFSATPYTAAILGTPTDTIGLEVTLSVASLTLKSTVSATIVADNGALTDYNAAQLQLDPTYVAYQPLSSSDYTVQNGGKVTINPGQQIVKVRVNIAGDKVNFLIKNAISLKLTNASGAIIASNLSEALVLIKAKSIYQGTYQALGKFTRVGLDFRNFNLVKTLGTVTPNTVQSSIADLGASFPINLTVNPDNTVSIDFLGGSGLPGPYTQTGVNTYDPATKTFTLNYQYRGGLRITTETLTYTGP